MKNLLSYSAEGTMESYGLSYENTVRVREKNSLEMKLRSVARDSETGKAVYTNTVVQDIEEDEYEHWLNLLEISDSPNFPDVNPDSNLGEARPEQSLEDIMPSKHLVRYERTGGNAYGQKRELWAGEDQISADEVNLVWDKVEPADRYQQVFGDSIREVTRRREEDWERYLPDGFIMNLSDEEYELYRNLDLAEIAEENNMDTIALFKEFYSGEEVNNEYIVFFSEDGGGETIENPLKTEIEQMSESMDVARVDRIRSDSVDEYSEQELGDLIEEYSSSEVRTITESSSSENSVFEIFDENIGLVSIEGLLIPEAERDNIGMILNHKQEKKVNLQ